MNVYWPAANYVSVGQILSNSFRKSYKRCESSRKPPDKSDFSMISGRHLVMFALLAE